MRCGSPQPPFGASVVRNISRGLRLLVSVFAIYLSDLEIDLFLSPQ